jgi:hypothetical protein
LPPFPPWKIPEEDERLKKREKKRPPPSSQFDVDAQPDRVNNNVLARASEAKWRRRMGILFFRLFRKNRIEGCPASCIDAWH